MARRRYSNVASVATLQTSVNATDTLLEVDTTTGWPAIQVGDEGITALIDRGTASEEVVLVTSFTATALNVTRAQGGTSGKSHTSGASIHLVVAAVDADDANRHIFDTTLDQHSQYLNNTRHDVTGRHTATTLGNILTNNTPVSQAFGDSAAVGGGTTAARFDHTHGMPSHGTAQHGSTVVDHGSIGGLSDDDHSQYLNTSRHDVQSRHSSLFAVDASSGSANQNLSASFSDITGLSVTINSSGSKAYISGMLAVDTGSGNNTLFNVRILVDGVQYGPEFTTKETDNQPAVSFAWAVSGLSSGSHTYKVQAKATVVSGSSTPYVQRSNSAIAVAVMP